MAQEVSTVSGELAFAPVEAAQESFRYLSETMHAVTKEAAVRASESLPGLAEAFERKVLVNVGGEATGPLGHFATKKWRDDARSYHEIFVNVGHYFYTGKSATEQAQRVLTTVLHELVHFYARENGIKDTSGRANRYHNKKFMELATRLGLCVVNTHKSHLGYATTGMGDEARERHADLVARIEEALRLSSTPLPEAPSGEAPQPSGPEQALALRSKYIFAQCGCRDSRGRKRTIRIAAGWWAVGPIGCGVCMNLFTESPPARANSAPPAQAAAR